MKPLLTATALTLLAPAAIAEPALKHELAGLEFLIGHWSAGQGQVAETGGTSTGTSVIEPVAGGAALWRRDHTTLFDSRGKPAGAFDQVMLIYGEGAAIHADYLDGSHVIHYTAAVIQPGKSATFTAAGPGPSFKLTYQLQNSTTLAVAFSMAPPGGSTFRPIATGTLKRAP